MSTQTKMVLHQLGRLHQARAPVVPAATQHHKLLLLNSKTKEKSVKYSILFEQSETKKKQV